MTYPKPDVAKQYFQDADMQKAGTKPTLAQTSSVPAPRLSLDRIVVPHKRTNAPALQFALQLVDSLALLLIITLGIWNGYIGIHNKAILAPVAAGVMGATIFIVTLMISGSHNFHPTESFWSHQKKVFFAAFSALGLWLAIALWHKPDTFLPDVLAKAGIAGVALLFILHTIYYKRIRRLHNNRALAPNIVMLGATETARRMIEQNAKNKELNILAIFDDRLSRAPRDIHGVPVVGKVDDLLSWEELPFIDRIIVTLPGMAAKRRRDLADQVRLLPNRIAFVVDEFENFDHLQQRLSQIARISVQDIAGRTKSASYIAFKRLMDIVISGAVLIFGAPVLALIALAIKLDSPGSILFKQPRHGFNNRIFNVYKFRSLRTEREDKKAAQQVTAGDSRVTKVGRFIRKTSLDELPQLFNVLKGDMSLVGPRPHAIGMRTGDVESYKLVDEYAHRHQVKPGMTGWAQIKGSRGPLHDAESVERRVALDIEYIERSSLWFDLMIIIKTVPCLLGDSENIR